MFSHLKLIFKLGDPVFLMTKASSAARRTTKGQGRTGWRASRPHASPSSVRPHPSRWFVADAAAAGNGEYYRSMYRTKSPFPSLPSLLSPMDHGIRCSSGDGHEMFFSLSCVVVVCRVVHVVSGWLSSVRLVSVLFVLCLVWCCVEASLKLRITPHIKSYELSETTKYVNCFLC